MSPPFLRRKIIYCVVKDTETSITFETRLAIAMEVCIYCGDPNSDWSLLRVHLSVCDYKKKIDVWRDEFKGVYGFYPSFTDVRESIDEARYKKETEGA